MRSFGIDVLGLITLPLPADPTIVGGRCADDNGHGTHVAGTAAAGANNGRGVAGVAFNSPLAICKALDRTGSGPVSGIANCIGYLVSTGAKVAAFSTANAKVEIAAPGEDVLSTWKDGAYRATSGTSMATPHVAGVAAIIASRVSGGPAAWRSTTSGRPGATRSSASGG